VLELNAKQLLEAISDALLVTKSESVRLVLDCTNLTVSASKDGFAYSKTLTVANAENDRLDICVDNKLLKAFLTHKDKVKIADSEGNAKFSSGRNRCSLPKVTLNEVVAEQQVTTEDITLSKELVNKIFSNAKYFNFTGKMYDLSIPLQVSCKDKTLRIFTLDYCYSAYTEEAVEMEDLEFDLTLSYIFLITKLFNPTNINLSVTMSNIIIKSDDTSVTLPKVGYSDKITADEFIQESMDNCTKENMICAFKVENLDEFKTSVTSIANFYKLTESQNNKIIFNLGENSSMAVDTQQGSNIELFDCNLKGKNTTFTCHVFALLQMLSSFKDNSVIVRVYPSRIKLTADNMMYQLLILA